MNICFLKIFSKDITVEEKLENSSLTEMKKWLKCEMKVMNESVSERKKRIKRMPVYLPKCWEKIIAGESKKPCGLEL